MSVGAGSDVLVGYASVRGSTRAVAERIVERLRRRGHDATTHDLAEPWPDHVYGAYVLGSAIHAQRWLPEARAALVHHAPAIAGRPLWMFSVGMPGALRFPWSVLALLQPPVVAAEFADVACPRDHRVFSGVVHDDDLPLLGRLLLWTFTTGPGDYRDWVRIDEWADGVAAVLTELAGTRVTAPGGERPDRAH